MGTLHENLCAFTIIRRSFLLRMMFHTNLHTQLKLTFHIQYFSFVPKSAVCEIMWKNMVEQDRQYNTEHAHCIQDN